MLWLLLCADVTVLPRGGRAGRAAATALPQRDLLLMDTGQLQLIC
jgi:hypothetical protein